MTDISAHDWFRPKLVALVAEAEAAGFARDVSMAVVTDLMNGALAAAVPPPSEANPNQDIGEPDFMASPESGAHPSLPVEPAQGLGNPLNHLGRHGGRHGGLGGSRL